MDIQIPMRLVGFFKLDVRGTDGELRRSTGWFRNLIVDNGLNGIGTQTMIGNCYVGTGTSAPANTDTSLAAYLANSGSPRSVTGGAASSSPYYKKNTFVFRFNAGVAAGNVSEIGIAPAGTVPQSLFSRALVLDGGGSPTTITVLSDEILDVTYELRAYLPASDWTSTITIGASSYDVTLRAADATVAPDANYGPGYRVSTFTESFAWSGAIASVTGAPSGTLISRATPGTLAYSNNSYRLDYAWTFPVDGTGDIQSVYWATSYGNFQIGFSPAIHKASTQTMPMTCRLAWARKDSIP